MKWVHEARNKRYREELRELSPGGEGNSEGETMQTCCGIVVETMREEKSNRFVVC